MAYNNGLVVKTTRCVMCQLGFKSYRSHFLTLNVSNINYAS
jgi:hypothetical protein